MLPEIRKLLDRLDREYTDINFGGCCVIATHLARHLREKRGVKVQIKVIDPYNRKSLDVGRSKYQEMRYVRDWNKNGVDFCHVVTVLTWRRQEYVLDTDHGCLPAKKYWGKTRWKPLQGELTQAEAEAISKDTNWNSMFDRRQIPRIKQTIGRVLRPL